MDHRCHEQHLWLVIVITPIDHAHCRQMGVVACKVIALTTIILPLSFHAYFALRGNSSMTEWSTKQCLFCYCMLWYPSCFNLQVNIIDGTVYYSLSVYIRGGGELKVLVPWQCVS